MLREIELYFHEMEIRARLERLMAEVMVGRTERTDVQQTSMPS